MGMARKPRERPKLIFAFLGVALLGAASEWHQMHLLSRKAGWQDFTADVVYSLGGVALLARGRITPK